MNRRCAASVTLAFALASIGRTGLAQTDDLEGRAAQLFRAGSAAYAQHEYRAAAAAFEQAYALVPRSLAILDAGLAWEAAEEKERAADAYDKALAGRELERGAEVDARARLERLERVLGRVEVRGPADATVSLEQVVDAPLPLRMHVRPGFHEARVRFADGTSTSHSFDVSAGATAQVSVRITQGPAPARSVRPLPTSSSSNASRTVGWILVGSSALVAGAAVVLGLRTLSTVDTFNASGHHDAHARDTALTLRTLTNVALATSAIVGVAGTTLVITSTPKAATVAWTARF
jgi:hypothetical protein